MKPHERGGGGGGGGVEARVVGAFVGAYSCLWEMWVVSAYGYCGLV